jgi:hypothetical protein
LVECHNVDPARTCVGAPLIVIKECIELRKTARLNRPQRGPHSGTGLVRL